jgi:hypothetical protein
MSKCECGSKEFLIMEGIVHKAEIDEEGNLTAYKVADNAIEGISCGECGKPYPETAFNKIDFN